MKLFLLGVLLVFINNSGVVAHDDRLDNFYSSLIEVVYDRYGTSGLLILDSTDYDSFADTTGAHHLVRRITTKFVYSLFINYPDFEERLKTYVQKPLRPLVAVFIDDMIDVTKFRAITANWDMSYPLWLVIFTGSKDTESCNVCRNPVGNPFNLKLNSRVIVFCCNTTILEDWWSDDGNDTVRLPLGKWNADEDEIKWLTEKSTAARRAELERELSVVIINESVSIHPHEGELQGFVGELLTDLMRHMKVKISVLIQAESFGVYDNKTKSWTGATGIISRKEADIAVGEFTMTSQRLDAVKFTAPIAYGQSKLYIKRPDGAVLQWDAYFKMFDASVWKAIIALILIIPLLLTFTKYYLKKSTIWPMLLEHYLSVWGIYCQQGLSEFPSETPLRIMYVSLFITALVISAAYSGSLISILAVSSIYLPFETPEEFVRDGSYQLIVLKDTADYEMFRDSNDTHMKKMRSLMKPEGSLPRNAIEGFRQVCNEQVAFHLNEVMRRMVNERIPCQILAIDTRKTETIAMIVPRDSVYLNSINYHLHRFRDAGYFRLLSEKYMKRQEEILIATPEVHLWGVAPIFFVLACGILMSLIALLLERAHHDACNDSDHLVIDERSLKRIKRKIRGVPRKARFGKIKPFYAK